MNLIQVPAKKEYCKSLRLLEKNVMQAVNEAIQKEFQK